MENEVIRIFWSSYLTVYERIGKRDNRECKFRKTTFIYFKHYLEEK